MVKKIIFSFCLSVFATFSNCQDLPLIVDTTLEWSVLYGNYFPDVFIEKTEYLKIQGDSTVDDTDYKMIYRNRDPYNGFYFDRLLIREDSIKVYLLEDNQTERVLYDFSLEIGDTIRQQNMYWDEVDWIVQEIDSIEIESTYRKQIHLIDVNYGVPDKWIEGIGSTYGLLTPGNFVIDAGTELLCVKRDLQNIYLNPVRNTCFIYASTNNTLLDDKLITIYPNPANDLLYFETDLNINNFRVFDISGKMIKSGVINNDYIIDLKDIRAGFYIIILNSTNSRHVTKVLKE